MGRHILLVDDFHLCRAFFAEGMRRFGLNVTEADSSDAALRQIELKLPGAVLMNLTLRHGSGIALVQYIHRQFPQLGILAFCRQNADLLFAERALCSGASGFIPMDASAEELLAALDQVAAGGEYLAPGLKKCCRKEGGKCGCGEAASSLESLSHREFEVFFLTGSGFVPKRIAEKLQVSVKTVETYRERIRSKLGIPAGGDLLYHATAFVRDGVWSNAPAAPAE